MQKNVRLSEVVVSGILDSDQLPIISLLLDHIRSRNISDPVDKLTDWEQFQSLVSELISPRIQINSGEEGYKAAREFTTSTALAHRLSTSNFKGSILSGGSART
jgi:hypothetical protein